MQKLKCIVHKDLNAGDLEKIIKIKSVAWKYNHLEQKKWIKENIRNEDLHILLQDEKNEVAYLNLINVEFEVDGVLNKAYGVGNVCSAEKGKGYGGILMKKLAQLLEAKQVIGLLFCKKDLLPFYEKYGWKTIDSSKLTYNKISKDIFMMAFNLNKYEKIFYSDIQF